MFGKKKKLPETLTPEVVIGRGAQKVIFSEDSFTCNVGKIKWDVKAFQYGSDILAVETEFSKNANLIMKALSVVLFFMGESAGKQEVRTLVFAEKNEKGCHKRKELASGVYKKRWPLIVHCLELTGIPHVDRFED
jgi:hypothetical protein